MIGDNIKAIREQCKMTQAELADAIGVKRQTISSWEVNRTEPNMRFIDQLTKALKCQNTDLIGDTPIFDNTDPQDNPQIAKIAQWIFDNPEARILFNAAQDNPPENLLLAADMLRRMKGTDKDG